MDDFLKTTSLYIMAISLSLLIERFLEMAKSVYDLIDSRRDLNRYWTAKAYKIRDRAESKLTVFDYVSPEAAAPVLARFSEMLLGSQGDYSGTVPILSGDLVRALHVKVWSKALGVVVGISLAFPLNLDLFQALGGPAAVPAEGFGGVLRLLVSGTAIGLGSSVVHKLIKALESAKDKKKSDAGGGA
jgi:hypothetical protein